MGDYDIVIKRALRQGSDQLCHFLEIPTSGDLDTQAVYEHERRADLLRISEDKKSTHQVEFQTRHDPLMPFRMLEYFTTIVRTEGQARYGDNFRSKSTRNALREINLHQTVLHLTGAAGQRQFLRSSNPFGMGTIHRYRNRYLSEIPYNQFRHSDGALDIILSLFSEDAAHFDPVLIVHDTIEALEAKFGSELTSDKKIAYRNLYVLSTLRGLSLIVLERYHQLELTIDIVNDANAVKTNHQLLKDAQDAFRQAKLSRLKSLIEQITHGPIERTLDERLQGASFFTLEDLHDDLTIHGPEVAIAAFLDNRRALGPTR